MPDKAIEASQAKKNPFTPEFGKVPAYFAGREDVLSELLSSFEDGSTNICSLFVGARGIGKTALLTYLGTEAERFGWVTANASAMPGMLDDILERSYDAASHIISEEPPKRSVKDVGVAGVGSVEWNVDDVPQPNWRSRMSTLLDSLNAEGIGLLITVDEVDASLDETVQLVAVYQHFVRENRKVGLLMAGLPFHILSLLNGKSTSFVRRAQRFNLGPLSDVEVEEAFRLTVENGGRLIGKEALDEAVCSIQGFPFLFQLLGHRAWRAHPESETISLEDIHLGADLAVRELETRIFDATYAELSPADKAFLAAMLEDESESTRADLMARLGKPSAHISTYKRRLTQSGIIDETFRKTFRFALPGFREYLERM